MRIRNNKLLYFYFGQWVFFFIFFFASTSKAIYLTDNEALLFIFGGFIILGFLEPIILVLLIQRLKKQTSKKFSQKYASELQELVLPAIRLKHQNLTRDNIQISKYGGFPNITSLNQWPKNREGKYLDFIGQIYFQHLNQEIKQKFPIELPKEGVLLFFLDVNSLFTKTEINPNQDYQIVYTKETVEKVAYEKPLQYLSIKLTQLVPELFDSYPSYDDEVYNPKKILHKKVTPDAYFDLCLKDYHQLLGHPATVQHDPRCDILHNEIQVVKTDEDRSNLHRLFKNWRLLWQIVSDPKIGLNLGGLGTIYMMIEQDRLVRYDFSNVRIVFQIT